jgi:hypothetical protein
MAPAMVSATSAALIASTAFKRLPAALLGLGHASALASIATRIAAPSAATAPEVLVAVAPAGFVIAFLNRAGSRRGLPQAEQPL